MLWEFLLLSVVSPERVVHARGFVCYGQFEATGKIGDEPASKYTHAKLFQEAVDKNAAEVARIARELGSARARAQGLSATFFAIRAAGRKALNRAYSTL